LEIVAPIVLSLLAGSATGIGGLLVLAFGEVNERLIGFFMGFAGGVMLVVSFLQLYAEALTVLPPLKVTLAFGVGTVLMMFIDLMPPTSSSGSGRPG